MAAVGLGKLELVPRTAIDAGQLVALINRAYRRYPILVEDRINAAGFALEVQPDSEFMLVHDAGRVIGCAMVCRADGYFAATRGVTGTKPGNFGDGSPPPDSRQGGLEAHADLPFAGDLTDALYFGLAAVDLDSQLKGTGQRLLSEAEAIAAARGFGRVVLTTLREFGLEEYYRCYGYTTAGAEAYEAGHWSVTVPHHYCYMEKRLGGAGEKDTNG